MRKFWKFWLCGIIAVTFSISGLSGCSLVKDSESESSSESSSSSKEDLPKSQAFLSIDKDCPYGEGVKNIVDAFEKEYAETSFADGEKGVDILVTYDSRGSGLNPEDQILFSQNTFNGSSIALLEWESMRDILKISPMERDGNYYTLPYIADTQGLVYNVDLFTQNEWSVPNTTTELLALCDAMNGKATPLICNADKQQYWNSMLNVWWAQYAGVETYDAFWNGTNADGEYTHELFKEQGRLKALTVLETLITNQAFSPKSYTYLSESDAMQTFVTYGTTIEQLPIAMIPFGEGFVARVQEYVDAYAEQGVTIAMPNLNMMKMPVISSIIERCTTIADDSTLSAVITAIDKGENSYTGVSTQDFALVKSARAVSAYSTPWEFAVSKKVASKKCVEAFFEFLLSKRAYEIALESDVVPALNYTPTEAQMAKLNPLHRAVLDTTIEIDSPDGDAIKIEMPRVYLPIVSHKILYGSSNYRPFWFTESASMITALYTKAKTAQAIYEDTIAHYTKEEYEYCLDLVGIKIG